MLMKPTWRRILPEAISLCTADVFPRARFLELCQSIRMTGEATDVFWQKCVAHRIIVERSIRVCAQPACV